MPSLKTCGSRFDSWFTIESGGSFKGVLETPLDREPPAFLFVENRRLLTVASDCIVAVRDVIRSGAGELYAVGASTYAEYGASVLYRTHRLFEMTQQLNWSRKNVVTDTLTGLEKEDSINDFGSVWCTVEYPNREDIDRQTKIHQEALVCITPAEFREGDRVGNRQVIRLTTQLGLTLATLQ